MKKILAHVLEIGCSGLIGVILTISFQYIFPQEQSFTFIIDGEKVALTEPELQEQLNATQSELDLTKENLDSKDKELASKDAELNELKAKIDKKELVNVGYSDFLLNISGETINEYKKSMLDIEGKNYILSTILNEITNEDIKYENNILYVGHSTGEVVNLMDACPPHDIYRSDLYSTDVFKMSGELYYDGFKLTTYNKNYTLINLKNQYSSLEFDFGHVDDTAHNDCTLNIYIDDKLVETIDKQPDSMIDHKVIQLNYAKYLKIEISGSNVTYGFGNIKLKY